MNPESPRHSPAPDTDRPHLVAPSLAYAESYARALRDYRDEGLRVYGTPGRVEEAIAYLLSKPHPQDDRKVPETVFWLVRGAEYLGTGSIRHYLNATLRAFGGHIGYKVAPMHRQQGHGTRILTLLLDEARRMDMTRVMITCDVKNSASRRIIEKHGGQLEDIRTITWHDHPFCRFWIDL